MSLAIFSGDNSGVQTKILEEKTNDKTYQELLNLPVVVNNSGVTAVDHRKSRTHKGDSPSTILSTNLHLISFPTQIGEVDPKGSFKLRGKDITSLCDQYSFPQVAYLAYYGKTLPLDNTKLAQYQQEIIKAMNLNEEVIELIDLGLKKNVPPIEILASTINFAGSNLTKFDTEDSIINKIDTNAPKLIGLVLSITAYIFRKSQGFNYVPPNNTKDVVENFVEMMYKDTEKINTKEKKDFIYQLMNKLLILRAEHGLAPSSFTARTVASTHASPSAGLAAAINSISGALHGDKTKKVIDVLNTIKSNSNIDDIWNNLSEPQKVAMGIGHTKYKSTDPRTTIYKQLCQEIFTHEDLLSSDKIKEKVELAKKLETKASQCNSLVNAHFYSSIIYEALDIPQDLKILMFPAGRVAGILAHMKEQLSYAGHIKDRPIRPGEFYLN